jgi:hypothetical protein
MSDGPLALNTRRSGSLGDASGRIDTRHCMRYPRGKLAATTSNCTTTPREGSLGFPLGKLLQ